MNIKYFIGDDVIIKKTGEHGTVVMTPYSNNGLYKITYVKNKYIYQTDKKEHELKGGE